MLCMTLLVRDEIDIIRTNLEFHLEHGVDHVVATDNGSIDGTRDVLTEFVSLGVLTLIDEARQDYSQWRWVSRMAVLAREELGAVWVLNADADELWLPRSGNLKTGLESEQADLIRCQRRNMMCGHDLEVSSWLRACRYRISTPLALPELRDPMGSSLAVPYVYFDLPPKVLCRTRGLVRVEQGNHHASYTHSPRVRTHDDIVIYHYPFRSKRQFEQKISNGGASYARNQELEETTGWHWRRWFTMLRRGELDRAYREALPSTNQIERELATGHIVEDRRLLQERHTAAIATGENR